MQETEATMMTSRRVSSARVAAWRPAPGRNSIWLLTVHSAYWKYRIHRLLTDAPPRAFEKAGSNFFPAPEPENATEDVWAEDRALLGVWHRRLRGVVAAFDPARLDQPSGRSGRSYRDLILGGAAHDLYHAGQIQLLKRLQDG